MNLAYTIKQLCRKCHVSIAELARRSNQSSQNLGKKLNNETLRFDEFMELLDALGMRFEYSITESNGENVNLLPDGERMREKINLIESQVAYEKKKVEFYRNVCSDIRTSLFTMIGNVKFIEKHSPDNERIGEYISKINCAYEQMKDLLDDILSMEGSLDDAEDEPKIEINPDVIRGSRILLVDDNDMNREIAKDVLLDNGIQVEEATSGSEAVRLVSENLPGYYDCVLMDIQMPELDGFEATTKIRELPNRVRANVPIVAMTANAFKEDKTKSYKAGMDAYLTKPIEVEKLLRILTRFA